MATAATVAAVVDITATAYSLNWQRRAAADQEKAARIERRRQEIADARARRKAVAQANQQRSSIRAEAANKGAAQSSAVRGALDSVFAQTAEAVGFSYGQEAAAMREGALQTSANTALNQARVGEAIGNLPGQVGLQPSFASAFSTDNTSTTVGGFNPTGGTQGGN